jgi:hypothetical protein
MTPTASLRVKLVVPGEETVVAHDYFHDPAA